MLLGFDSLYDDFLTSAGAYLEFDDVSLGSRVQIGIFDDDGKRIVVTKTSNGFQFQNPSVLGVSLIKEGGSYRGGIECHKHACLVSVFFLGR